MLKFSLCLGKFLPRFAKGLEVYTGETLVSYASNLIHVADYAQTVFASDHIKKVSELLRIIPKFSPIADYYEALGKARRGTGDIQHSRRLLCKVINSAPPKFKARTLALGTSSFRDGDYESALKLYSEAAERAAYNDGQDPRTTILSSTMISLMRGLDGDHRAALDLLEGTLPLAQLYGKTYPAIYFDHLNSMAVELIEVGRIDEATDACYKTLASPFASVYPSWQETWRELQERKGCPPSPKSSGSRSTKREAVEQDLGEIALPSLYTSFPIDPMILYRKNRTWPANAPGENATLLSIAGYKQTKEASMKKRQVRPSGTSETDIKNMTLAQKQTKAISLYISQKRGDESSKVLDKLLELISPSDKERRFFELVLASGTNEESVDRILSFLIELSEEVESKRN